MKVAIIGAGLGGLATACYLAKDGHKVTIYEKNPIPGGRAMVFSEKEFTFDMGPSWYWMPHIFEKFFNDFGKKVQDYYTLERLSPSYRVFFSEKEQYDIPSELSEFYSLIETFEPGSSQRLKRILDNGRYLLQTAEKRFLYRAYPNIFSMLIKELILDGIRTMAFVPLDWLIKKNFKNEKLRKLVTWHSLFLGASPNNLPALYSFILNVDFEMGTWYPQGGMYQIVQGIVALATELGVTIQTNTEISSLNIQHGNITEAIDKDGNRITADLFIANADYHHVETALLPNNYRSISAKQWKNKTISPSTLLFYIGINTKLKNSLHHNYYFSLETWDDHFNSLFGPQKKWPTGIPSYYFHATSKTDHQMAPIDGESIFVLIPVASGLADTEAVREDIFDRVVSHMELLTQTPIKKHIVFRKIHGQTEHTQLYNAYLGNNFGLAQTLFQTGAWRPYNKSNKVNNLYFVGHYTHPGIGLPMVLISGYVTAQLIKKKP